MNRNYVSCTLLSLLCLLIPTAMLQADTLQFPKTEAEWNKALNPKLSRSMTSRGIALNKSGMKTKVEQDPPRAGALVTFDYNSAVVRADANAVLDALGRTLANSLDSATLTIEGYTDSQGDADYNLRLSKKRAEAVRNYLMRRHHVAPQRLQIAAYGEERPIASNDSESGRALNRRVEFVRMH